MSVILAAYCTYFGKVEKRVIRCVLIMFLQRLYLYMRYIATVVQMCPVSGVEDIASM